MVAIYGSRDTGRLGDLPKLSGHFTDFQAIIMPDAGHACYLDDPKCAPQATSGHPDLGTGSASVARVHVAIRDPSLLRPDLQNRNFGLVPPGLCIACEHTYSKVAVVVLLTVHATTQG